MELFEAVEVAVAEVDFGEVTSVFGVFDGEDGPGIAYFYLFFHLNNIYMN